MMNAKRSSPKKLAIYALILPVLLITTLAFTITKKEIKKRLLPIGEVFTNVAPVIEAKVINKLPVKKINAKKKKIFKFNVQFRSDSTGNLTYMVRTIRLIRDSLHNVTNDLPPFLREMSGKVNASITSVLIRGTKVDKEELLLANVDTTGTNGKMIRLENVNVGYGTSSQALDHQANDKLREIVVRGYGRIARPLDSIKNKGKIDYFLNGIKLNSAEELKKVLNPEDIKNIAVKDNSSRTEILIVGKKSNP